MMKMLKGYITADNSSEIRKADSLFLHFLREMIQRKHILSFAVLNRLSDGFIIFIHMQNLVLGFDLQEGKAGNDKHSHYKHRSYFA